MRSRILGWSSAALLLACGGNNFTAAQGGAAGDGGAAGSAGGSAAAGGASGSGGVAGSAGTAGGSAGVAGSPGGRGGTSAGGAAGAAGAGSGGAPGGAAGMVGSGGAAGSSGMAGMAGAAGAGPCTDGGCDDASYCHSDGKCRPCTDTSELEFDDPEALEAINAAHTEQIRYIRPIPGSTNLLYVVGTFVDDRKIHLATDPRTAGTPLPPPVDQPMLGENGALQPNELPPPPVTTPNFFFDRTTGTGAFSPRELWAGTRDGAGIVSNLARMPQPFNSDVMNTSDWNLAVARDTGRLWWHTNREALLRTDLVTIDSAATTVPPARVNVTTDPGNCSAGGDLTPWVTPNGTGMVLRAPEQFNNCMDSNPTTDLYWLELAENGQPAAIAQPIEDVTLQNVTDSDPSFSPNLCWLYFSSNRDGASALRAWRARRK